MPGSMRKLLQMTRDSLRNNGVVRTLRIIVEVLLDSRFDARYGTDTAGWVELTELSVDAQGVREGTRYGPTLARPFRKLLKRLALPADSVFVDIGCGKGRAALVAATCGIGRCVGVEFAPELCRQARRNVEVFAAAGGLNPDIRIVECNATDYVFSDDDNVIYLYDPFSQRPLERVLKNLKASLARRPRRLWLIYQNLPFPDLPVWSSLFSHTRRYGYGGLRFTVFTNAPSA